MGLPGGDPGPGEEERLVAEVTKFVKSYMSSFDASHDFHHVQRVLRLALYIQSRTPCTSRFIVSLAALLHDVGDKKYAQPGKDTDRLVFTTLCCLGAQEALAEKVQAICLGVSYSTERADPGRVGILLETYPELAVVQDADRLDAIGMVGVARAFAFGGARGGDLDQAVQHAEVKLLRLEGMMKTETGRLLARERTARVEQMLEWWHLETESILPAETSLTAGPGHVA